MNCDRGAIPNWLEKQRTRDPWVKMARHSQRRPIATTQVKWLQQMDMVILSNAVRGLFVGCSWVTFVAACLRNEPDAAEDDRQTLKEQAGCGCQKTCSQKACHCFTLGAGARLRCVRC